MKSQGLYWNRRFKRATGLKDEFILKAFERSREITQKKRRLINCDEVAVGFGRTGRCLHAIHEDVQPDIKGV